MTWNPNEASTWSPNTQNQGPKEGLEEDIQMQKSSGWWRVAFIKEPGTLRNSVRGQVEKKTKKKKKKRERETHTQRSRGNQESMVSQKFKGRFKKEQAATDISCCQIIGHVDKSSFNDQMGQRPDWKGLEVKELAVLPMKPSGWQPCKWLLPPHTWPDWEQIGEVNTFLEDGNQIEMQQLS